LQKNSLVSGGHELCYFCAWFMAALHKLTTTGLRPRSPFRAFIAVLALSVFSSPKLLMICLGLTLATASLSASLSAQVVRSNEADLKAAFLFNFIRFTEWPPDEMANKKEPFVIGVLGKDPFGAALDRAVEGETFNDKPIVVRRFARMDESVGNSHALFIGLSEGSHLPSILKLLDSQNILTVSEIENFVERGGAIELQKEGGKLVFEVNIGAAKRAGLGISAQLLRLAKLVKQ
jgi:hypothetical protein